MSVQSLRKINKSGFVRGAAPTADQLYANIFGPTGQDITVDVKNQYFKDLMFFHYKKLGKNPPVGLPRQLGGEIFKKLEEKVKKSGGFFKNGKGEQIDHAKAARSKLCGHIFALMAS